MITAAHCLIDTDPDCGPRAIPPGPPVCTALVDPGGDGTSKMDGNDADVIVGRTTLTGAGGTEGDATATYVAGNYTGELTKRNDLGFISLATASGQPRIDIVDKNEGLAWKAGALTRVSGHGSIVEGGPQSDTLKVATVPVISDSSCGSSAVYGPFFDKVSMICAGVLAGGTDACQGDSGGPLQTAAAPARHAARRHRQLRRGVRQGRQAGRVHPRRTEPALHPGGPDRRPDRRERGSHRHRRRADRRAGGLLGHPAQWTRPKKKCKKKKEEEGQEGRRFQVQEEEKKKKGKK